ncbi:hypothetical protein ACOZ4Y_04955 [Komagataeibacter rhaeticus]
MDTHRSNNCGLPVQGRINQAFIPTPTVGAQDCDLTVDAEGRGNAGMPDDRAILRQ